MCCSSSRAEGRAAGSCGGGVGGAAAAGRCLPAGRNAATQLRTKLSQPQPTPTNPRRHAPHTRLAEARQQAVATKQPRPTESSNPNRQLSGARNPPTLRKHCSRKSRMPVEMSGGSGGCGSCGRRGRRGQRRQAAGGAGHASAGRDPSDGAPRCAWHGGAAGPGRQGQGGPRRRRGPARLSPARCCTAPTAAAGRSRAARLGGVEAGRGRAGRLRGSPGGRRLLRRQRSRTGLRSLPALPAVSGSPVSSSMARQPTDQMSEAVVTALSSTTCAGSEGRAGARCQLRERACRPDAVVAVLSSACCNGDG